MGCRIVPIPAELLTEMITTGYRLPHKHGEVVRCTHGLPAGAVLVGVDLEFYTNTVLLKYTHPDWTDGPPGGHIVRFAPEYTVTHAPADPEPLDEAAYSAFGKDPSPTHTGTPDTHGVPAFVTVTTRGA